MRRALETLRRHVLGELAHHYSVDNLRVDTLELRIVEALAADTSDELRSVLWDLPGWRPSDRVRCRWIAFEAHPVIAIELDDEPRTWTIGRSRSSDVMLHDPVLSRRHAQISVRARRCMVRDLGSANGLWLNGSRIQEPAALKPGDSLSFAGVLEATVR